MTTLHIALFVLLLPIPFFHLLLHAFLRLWRRYPLLAYGIGALLWIAAAVLGMLTRNTSWRLFTRPDLLMTIATVLGVIGLALAIWSFVTIGARRFLVWAVLKPQTTEQKYIPSGPFRFLSHPAYTGYMLVWFALAVGTGNAIFIGVCVFNAMLFPIVVQFENHEMRERLSL